MDFFLIFQIKKKENHRFPSKNWVFCLLKEKIMSFIRRRLVFNSTRLVARAPCCYSNPAEIERARTMYTTWRHSQSLRTTVYARKLNRNSCSISLFILHLLTFSYLYISKISKLSLNVVKIISKIVTNLSVISLVRHFPKSPKIVHNRLDLRWSC